MLSNSQIKFIRSLHLKKFREKEQLSFAEGSKLVLDLLQNRLAVKALIALPEWIKKHSHKIPSGTEIWEAAIKDMERITALKTPSEVMLLFGLLPGGPAPTPSEGELFLLLDDIRDPGNLGTIIRTCDWFGLRNLMVSNTTVEAGSPKTIQAAMGSFGRVNVYPVEPAQYVQKCAEKGVMIAGAFMEGQDVREISGKKPGLLIIGNEGQGISQQLIQLINTKYSIPAGMPAGDLPRAESLNASIAAAILIFALSKD